MRQNLNPTDSASAPVVQGKLRDTDAAGRRGRGNGRADQARGGPQEVAGGVAGLGQELAALGLNGVQGAPVVPDDTVVADDGNADDTGLEDGEDDGDDSFSDLVDNSADWPLDPARYADADKAQGICFDGLVPFTIAENATERLTKAYAETADGLTFRKLKGPYTQNSGRFIQAWMPASQTMTAFNALLETFTFRQALVPGVFAAAAKMLKMRRKAVVLRQTDASSDPAGRAIYRGKDQLGYVAGQPGLLALDHDVGELQALEAAAALERLGGLSGVLTEIDPQWGGIGLVMRASCSTGIKDTRTGRTKPIGGWHLYAIGQDGADFGRYARAMFVRAALLGVIYVLVDPVGGLHVRGLLDLMASGVPDRLMFEAPAVLEGDHLIRDPSLVPPPTVHEGGMLDTHALPDLTADEERRFAKLVVELKAEKEPAARALQLQARQVGVAKAVANGLTQAQAEAQALAAFNSRRLDLHADYWFMQKLPDGNMHASGAAMLAHPDPMVFDGILGPDVLDPGYEGGRQVAKWWCSPTGGGFLASSYAHGGERDGRKIYSLSYEASDAIERVTTELTGLPAGAVIEGLRRIMQMYWPSDAEQGRLTLRAARIPSLAVFDFDDVGALSVGALQAGLVRRDWLRIARMRAQMGVVFDAAVDELRAADEDVGLGIAQEVPGGWNGLGGALDVALEAEQAAGGRTGGTSGTGSVDDASAQQAPAPDTDTDPIVPAAKPQAPYPIDVLPGLFRDAVLAVSRINEVDPSMSGTVGLAVTSLSVSRLAPGVVWSGNLTPATLYAMVISPSSERKTSTDRKMSEGVRRVETQDLAAEHKAAEKRFKAEKQIYERNVHSIIAHRGAATRRPSGTGPADDAGPDPRLDDLLQLTEPEPPKQTTIVTEDVTVEGARDLLSVGHGLVGVVSSEGATVLNGHSLGRQESKNAAGGNMATWWDGLSFTTTRAGRTIVVQDPRVVFCLGVQPRIAARFFSDEDLADQGTTNRFLVAWPPARSGSRTLAPPTGTDLAVLKQFNDRLADRLRQALGVGLGLFGGPPRQTPLPLAPDAEVLRQTFAREMEAEQRKGERFEFTRGMAAKAAEQALRIALVLQLFEDPDADAVSAEMMQAAVKLARWYADEWLRVTSVPRAPQLNAIAVRVLEWLERHYTPDGETFTARDIYTAEAGGVRGRDGADRVLSLLARTGHVKGAGTVRVSSGRAPLSRWRLSKNGAAPMS